MTIGANDLMKARRDSNDSPSLGLMAWMVVGREGVEQVGVDGWVCGWCAEGVLRV